MRVLHLITTLQAGGAQTMLTNLVTRAKPGGRLQHVVVEMMADGECGERIRQYGVPVHSLNMPRGRASPGGVWRLVRVLRSERPTLVQTWLYHADLLGLLASPVLRVPVVWNIRSAWHYGIDGPVPRLCARLSRFPAAVIVNSRAGQRAHMERGYRPRRWSLIGNGFDMNVFKPDEQARLSLRAELGVAANTQLVGLVGRWDAHKGHAPFLAAAAALLQQHGDAHFVLAGQGLTLENGVVREMISSMQLSERVHLLGSRADIPRITAALDVASCTSIAEAFPNVVGEAMSAGVPCVATNVGDAAELVGDPDLIVPPSDPTILAAAWSRLLSMDVASRRAKGIEGRFRIARSYSIEAIVEQYQSLYCELADNVPPASGRDH